MEFVNSEYLKQEDLSSNSKMCSKLDWLTVVFHDCSMREVLRWIGQESALADFLNEKTLSTRGLDQKFVFMYNGIRLEAPTLIFYGVPEDICIFDLTIPSIRLDLSGTALDFLRSCGFDVNKLRYVEPVSACPGMTYRFTRADFAYDFVNYHGSFVDELIDFVNVNRLPSGRVPLAGTSSAISCSVRTGNEKTVYLGSPQSDKLLRVYDKRLQYINRDTGVYRKENPYDNPDSWFRIEWQTRNAFADGLVRNKNADFLHVLRLIFDRYAFAKADFDARNKVRPPVDFWLKLLNWEDIKKIDVQNGDLVYFKSPEERLELAVCRGAINHVNYISRYGLLAYLEKLCEVVNLTDLSDPVVQRRLDIYSQKINEFNIPVHIVTDGDLVPGWNSFNGKMVWYPGEVTVI